MAKPRPRSGPSALFKLISALLAIVGAYSLYYAVLGPVDDVTRLFFGVVFVLSFSFVIMSMFRVRRGYSISSVVPYKVMSVVRCAQCSFKQIKNFTVGDYVAKTEGMCTQCRTGSLFINGIYTEGPPRR